MIVTLCAAISAGDNWVPDSGTPSVKEEAILNIPTTEDLPEGQGKVRMSWEAGLAVDHFEIMETGATEATSRVISSTEAAAGEAWVENLKSFTDGRFNFQTRNGNSL